MSTAAISYVSLKDAANEAKSVAIKLDNYADQLSAKVYKKLNNYNGNHTSYISNAVSKTNQKIGDLRKKSSAFARYSNDLYDLKDECVSVDKSVRSMVSTLTANFKSSHGIRNSNIQNVMNYYMTSLKNTSSTGRWVSSGMDQFDSIKDYIKQSLEDWWDFEGGKELVKGLLEAAIDMAIAVFGVINGAGVIALIGATIAIVNVGVNIINELRAYNETFYNDDPAMGRRRSGENTLQDTLRRESDSQAAHNIAAGIDIAQFACDTVDFYKDVKDFGKKGIKWLKENDLFSKDFFKNMGNKMNRGVDNIKCALKGNWSGLADFGKRLEFDFLKNVEKKFFSGDIDSVINDLKFSKSLLEGGFNKENISDTLRDQVILPSVPLFKTVSDKADIVDFNGIKMELYSFEQTTLKDFLDIYNYLTKGIDASNLFSDSIIDKKLLEKLSEISSVSISVPEIPAVV